MEEDEEEEFGNHGTEGPASKVERQPNMRNVTEVEDLNFGSLFGCFTS